MRQFVQLVLDLFDAPLANSPNGLNHSIKNKAPDAVKNFSTAQDGESGAKSVNGVNASNKLIHLDPNGHLGIENNVLQSKEQLEKSQVNLSRHPNAKRIIVLHNTEIAYAFRRSKRSTIGMSVGYDGLTVSAPRWVGWGEIESALYERADWIVKKIVEMKERQRFLSKRKLVWANGATLPVLGIEVEIVLDPAHSFNESGGALKTACGQIIPNVSDLVQGCKLYLGLALSAHSIQIQDAVQAWLMRQAKGLFKARLDFFAPQLNVTWTKLSLGSASTRWGSAGSDGAIRLNWRLIHFKMEVIDYVVVHELSHLRVMDHSPKFWETVKEVVPDFKERRAALSDKPVPIWS